MPKRRNVPASQLSLQSTPGTEGLRAKLAQLTRPTDEIGESLLASATYDGDTRRAILKFYDQKTGRFWLWEDNTGHRPYCYSKSTMQELEALKARKDVVEIDEVDRLDLLNDTTDKVRKIVTTDPLAIGGGNDSIRDAIRAWEADIKYYENYTYDLGLRMGTYYRVSGGKVTPVKHEAPETVHRSLEEVTRRNPPEFQPYLKEWAELLSEPLADFRRVALDIEVDNEEGRLPDTDDPKQPVIAVSFCNDKEKVVYLLRGDRDDAGLKEAGFAYEVFEDEADLLRAAFSKILDYPVIVSFNGDDFDLRYLQHRAERLQIAEDEDPIQLERVAASLKHGIHIDLYQFFRNRSIQVYAFSNKYTEHTLNGIAEALLGRSKIEFEGEVGDLPLAELAKYCLNDSQLTYEFTSMSGSVVMKLLQVISRIGKMPMNDVSRLGVSNWIRSMLFFEHRKIGALIPRQDELAEKGGGSTQAAIKGKKYKGGFVVEPKPGVYFDVSVLDFASLVFDESIFVRKRQTGQIYKTKIGEFVESRLPHGTGFAAKEIGPSWDVLSFDYGSQRAAWKTVTAVIRHPRQSDILEIVTESGRRVRITKGHSVIALDAVGSKKTVLGSELGVGDYIIALSSFAAEQTDTELDLLPHLRLLPEYEVTRGRKGLGSTIALRSRRSHRRFFVPRQLPLTPGMMWGLGYWLAGGWGHKGEYRDSLRIEASAPDIALARSKFESAGVSCWSSPSKTVGCSDLGINGFEGKGGRLPATILAKLVESWFGDYAMDKRIPDWILRLPLDLREAFLDGYYRGGGYKPNESGQYVVDGEYKVGSYSQVLVDGLMSLGLVSGFHCISKAHGSPESFLTWSRGAQTYRDTKRPPPELLARSEHVRSFAPTPFYGTHRGPPRYERVRKDSVAAYTPAFERFYKGNCHFEKIRKIVKVKNDLPVYDISVRGSESFFNADGVLVSNSLYPSLIKVHNLSYETVNCPHPECRSNTIPDTSSWVCTRRKGIISLVTGSLRDLRVAHYKPLTKDKTLPPEDRELYNVVSQGLKVFLNACFTGDTSLVTPTGVKNVKDMKVGDEVLNVNPETLKAEVDRVVEVQAFPYTGDMYHFRDKRFVDLMVTPNHRFLVLDRRARSRARTIFRTAEEIVSLANAVIPKLKGGVDDGASAKRISMLETAKSLGAYADLRPPTGVRLIDWSRTLGPDLQREIREHGVVCKHRNGAGGRLESHYRLPCRCVSDEDVDQVEGTGGKVLVGEPEGAKIQVRFAAEDLASLCGRYLSEGSHRIDEPLERPNGDLRGRSASILISQGYGRGNLRGIEFRGEVKGLLDRMELPNVHDSSDDKRYMVTSSVLREWVVSHCHDESADEKDASSVHVPRFVFESRTTVDAFMDAACKGDGNRRGRHSTKSEALAKDIVVLSSMQGAKAKMTYDGEVFRVVSKNVSSKLTSAGASRTRNVRRVPFEGTVYCVTTAKNHTVIAGRNGRFAHVGQSYGVLGFETFAFYCLPVAEATAALGRDAITRTISKCDELGIRVLYGDTDSTYLQNPSKDQVDTITRWTQNELGIELDLDKVYRYVAFSTRKKNYFGVMPDGTVDIKGLTGKKSVDGSTPMLVRVDGTQRLTTVERAFKEFKAGRSVEVVSITESLRTVWAPISDAFKHRVEDVYSLVTSKGRSLLLSGDHSVFLMDTFGRLKTKRTKDILPGDALVGARLIQAPDTPVWIETAKYLKTPTAARGNLLLSANPHSSKVVQMPRRIRVTGELAQLLGVYIAGASSSPHGAKGSNVIGLDGTASKEVCRAIRGSWKAVFGREIRSVPRRGAQRLFHLPALYGELFRNSCVTDGGTRVVPDFIFSSPRDVVGAFLKGYFSGDGRSNPGRVSSSSRSRLLLVGVAHLLSYFDVDCRIQRLYDARHRRYRYRLSVMGASSRKRFVEEIGFIQERFQGAPLTRPSNREPIPVSTDGLLTMKRSILSQTGSARRRQPGLGGRLYDLSLARRYNETIERLWKQAGNPERARLKMISRMINSLDVSYDEVVSVKRLAGPKVMYDFSVPGLERFVAGNLPTLLHNSQTPEYLKRIFYETLDILSSVKTPEDFERARSSTKGLLTKMISDLKGKKVPVQDLAFTVLMGKPTDKYNGTTPQHVRAAKQLEEKGEEIKAGEIIAYVKTKNPPYVKPAKLARPDEVDADKYIEYAHSMFDQLLDALDFSFDEMMGGTTLDLFWSS